MTTSADIASILLNIKAVILNVQEPFVYTSGMRSPIYCDNRLLISHVTERNIIIDAFIKLIEEKNIQFDVVAGTATAGIPHAAWIADRLQKPMVYVRSSAKAHGKGNQIEGSLQPGQTALVIEDLISTGKSSVAAGLALRDAGAIVHDCLAIFSYQLDTAKKQFFDNTINIHTLSSFTALIDVAKNAHILSDDEQREALAWNASPDDWQAP
jgi:orotate phosphoribosyltransferase